jgi:hypothetical protein
MKDSLDDRRSDIVRPEPVNERFIDLDDIDRNRDEMRQRRKSGPEIVECDFQTACS